MAQILQFKQRKITSELCQLYCTDCGGDSFKVLWVSRQEHTLPIMECIECEVKLIIPEAEYTKYVRQEET